jgi:hypothetical protein
MEIKCPFCKSPNYTMGYFLYGAYNCKCKYFSKYIALSMKFAIFAI